MREVRSEDGPAIARVHVDTWRAAYRGIMPDAVLDNLSYGQRAVSWQQILSDPDSTTLVAVVDDVIGFVTGGAERDPPSGAGSEAAELLAIYVLAEHQGVGVGEALVRELAKRLIGRGFRTLKLWVLDANSSGGRFYRKLGGRPVAHEVMSIAGIDLDKTAYSWEDLSTLARGS